LTNLSDFVSSHLRRELDFVLEAHNANSTAAFIASEPTLASTVYVPKVYDSLTTRKIMTAEWIDGVRMSDRDAVFRLMGESPISGAPSITDTSVPPLKGGTRSILKTMVNLFSAQMFLYGRIHCDPHPGNVIIRPHPSNPSHPQLVLLDHGLYVTLNEKLRLQWSALWKALLSGDYKTIETITEGWGVGLPDLFASAVVMNRYKFKESAERQQQKKRGSDEPEPEPERELTQYEQSVRMKAKLKEFLTDTDRMPKELLFLMRNMRSVNPFYSKGPGLQNLLALFKETTSHLVLL
jgi:aarF domain-containing kinase